MSLTEAEEELLEAALEKDVAKVRQLLDAGVSPNIKLSYNEYTPLHFAVHPPGNAELVQLLVSQHAEVDPLDKMQHTPLHDTKDPEIAEILLKAGAKVDRLTQDGETVLHRVAAFHESCFHPPPEEDSEEDDDDNHTDDKKSKLDTINTEGLNKMSLQDSNATMGCEVEQDAMQNQQTGGGGDGDGGDGDGDNNNKYSPKKHYIPSWDGESKQVECARIMLAAGEKVRMDVNHKDNAGLTAMHVAALNGASTMMKLFLQHGADADGKVPAADGNITTLTDVGSLTRSDETQSTTTTTWGTAGVTPLFRAAVPGYVECAKVLLEAGCRVNQRDVHGDTALHWTARHGHRRFARLLRRYGADATVCNRKGHTAHDVAQNEGQPAKMLRVLTLAV